jgi:hypothetical protein
MYLRHGAGFLRMSTTQPLLKSVWGAGGAHKDAEDHGNGDLS